jgi:hypothetical protein
LGKERCCESGLECGAIAGCAGADRGPLGALRMKIVSQRREQAKRVYYGAVFEIKEEIPVDVVTASPGPAIFAIHFRRGEFILGRHHPRHTIRN